MSLASFISNIKFSSTSDYFKMAKILESKIQNGELTPSTELRVSILSSFTTQGLDRVLLVEAAKDNVYCNTYVAGYNQYAAEILTAESGLYQSNPQLIFYFVDIRSLFNDIVLNPYSSSEKELRDLVEGTLDQQLSLLNTLRQKSSATIVVHNLLVPTYSPLGILENKRYHGLHELVAGFNLQLMAYTRQHAQVYLFDYDGFASEIGKEQLVDPKYLYIADIRLDPRHYPALARRYMSYVRPMCGKMRKCISLDMDNTVWGGVIGEDGIEGIRLGKDNQGLPFLEFQKALLALHQRGVILAINSKNNRKDVLDVLNKHPEMLLKEHHFAVICANWSDKVENIKFIASELLIALDSIVHIDDDTLQCEIIQRELPQVACLNLPQDPSGYLSSLRSCSLFDTLQITQEDMEKGEQYRAQGLRREAQRVNANIDHYLQELQMEVKIVLANEFTVPRIAQLTQKTNQFNMTTRRYTHEQIQSMSRDEGFLVVAVGVSDKFGDSGLTGLAIVEKSQGVLWTIDTLLLSCRVIGRKVEDALFAFVIEQARECGVEKIQAEFIRTEKNSPASDFYRRVGCVTTRKLDSNIHYEYEVSQGFPYPSVIKITKEI